MKCVIFSLLVLLSACSKSDNSPKIESPDIQESFLSAVVGQEDEILLDLGSFPYGKYKDGLISIKQNQIATLIPSGLTDGKLTLDPSSSPELSILSQSGCTSIKKTTGTCNIKIRANASGLQEGSVIQGSILVHTDPLTEAETRINITAVVGESPVIENPVALVSSTSSSINFGELSVTDNPKDLLITYRATSLLQASDSHQGVVSSPFVIQSASADRCSNKTISKGSSCTVKIRLDPKSVSTNGLISGNISFAGLTIPLSATITGNPEEGQPVDSPLVWIYNGSEISALDLGTLLSSNVPVKFNLYLKNKGTANETVNVTLSGSGFNIINRCQNKELLPQGQCSLEVRPESSEGSKSVSIAVDDQPSLSLPMNLVVTTTVEPVVTYATVDTTASCSSLNLQICGGTQNISKTYLCEQYIDGVKNESYSGNDCQPLVDMSDIVCQSSPGNLLVGILGGNLSYNCGAGVSSNDLTPTVLCDQGYSPDQLNLACIEDVVIPNRPLGKSYGFNSGQVNSIAIQEDGKMVVGGTFIAYNGTARNRIARLNSDGSLDTSFAVGTGFDNAVQSIAIQEDGKIIVGGNFTTYNATSSNRIARLNSDGSLDTSFAVGSGFDSIARSIAIQEDGKILIGGTFTNYNGTPINRIARLNSDGSLDTSFNVGTGFNNVVNSIAIQEDGKILIGGNFMTYKGTSSNRIARLNSDGSLDTSFNVGSGFDNVVFSLAIQEDGKIIVGGQFATYNGTTINRIARINSDGSLDTSFNVGSGFNNIVYSIAIQEDGKILIGGSLTNYNGSSASRIARLNSDGSYDTSFNVGTGFDNGVQSIAIQEDGKVVVGGQFISYNSIGTARIVRINSDGSLDASITVGTGFNNTVEKITIQEDGKIAVCGGFTTYNGTPSNYISRINSDGSLDTSFNVGTGFDNIVNSIATQEDGKILIGGNFTTYKGTTINRIARLNSDGSLDTSFNVGSGFDSIARSIAIQEDGKILIGGGFTTYKGTTINRIARLNSDGSLDTSFNVGTGFDNFVNSIAIQEDGKIVVGGQFTTYKGTAIARIARLNSDGSLDTSFNVGSGFNGAVNSIAIQEDGKVVVVGGFTTYNGTDRNSIARLNSDGSLDTSFNVGTGFNITVQSIAIQEDGKIIVGGSFTTYNGTASNYIVRINSDGSLDTSLNVGTGFNSVVRSIAIQEDGKVVVGGNFTNYNGKSYDRIIRLNPDGTTED